jgi:predicted DNA-binding antitoxin AbrB/MazE fold protein
MTITIAAIYEKGVLRPRQPLDPAEGTEVRFTISTAGVLGTVPSRSTARFLTPQDDSSPVLPPGSLQWSTAAGAN